MAEMTRRDSVTLWLEQVKDGDRAAVCQLLDRYFHRLVGLARSRLQGRPALADYDEDVALSAFKSLCLGVERGRFPDLADRHDLWRLLAVMTIRKAIDVQRRGRARERSGEADLGQLLSDEPPPELAAEVADEYQRLLGLLGDGELRRIALWKVEGHSNEEIAARLGCVERTVERKLQRIRILWAEVSDT
jgi:DNA-directed RNA polymerase specialized sigma24 family protein